jgi:hypothetical protein
MEARRSLAAGRQAQIYNQLVININKLLIEENHG